MGFEFKKKKELTLDIAGSVFKAILNAEFAEKVRKTGILSPLQKKPETATVSGL